jgi:hypothetical protein
VAASIINTSFPPGVFHIEQLFNPAQMIAKLKDKGLTFHSSQLEIESTMYYIFKEIMTV